MDTCGSLLPLNAGSASPVSRCPRTTGYGTECQRAAEEAAPSAVIPILRRMANIAELSVIVTGSVAVGVPLIKAGFGELRTRREARSQRLDELRSVLDDGAVALLAFIATSREIYDKLKFGGLEDLIPKMETGLRNIWQQEARIAVRLGVTHEVFKAFREAHERSVEYLTYARHALEATPPDGLLPDITARQSAAYRQFFDLAASVIGPNRK